MAETAARSYAGRCDRMVSMSSGGMASSGAVLFLLRVPAWWRDLIWAPGSGSIAVHRWMR